MEGFSPLCWPSSTQVYFPVLSDTSSLPNWNIPLAQFTYPSLYLFCSFAGLHSVERANNAQTVTCKEGATIEQRRCPSVARSLQVMLFDTSVSKSCAWSLTNTKSKAFSVDSLITSKRVFICPDVLPAEFSAPQTYVPTIFISSLCTVSEDSVLYWMLTVVMVVSGEAVDEESWLAYRGEFLVGINQYGARGALPLKRQESVSDRLTCTATVPFWSTMAGDNTARWVKDET